MFTSYEKKITTFCERGVGYESSNYCLPDITFLNNLANF